MLARSTGVCGVCTYGRPPRHLVTVNCEQKHPFVHIRSPVVESPCCLPSCLRKVKPTNVSALFVKQAPDIKKMEGSIRTMFRQGEVNMAFMVMISMNLQRVSRIMVLRHAGQHSVAASLSHLDVGTSMFSWLR